MHLRVMSLVALAVFTLATVASADVLWDQSDFDVWAAGFFNSESGEPPFGMTMHTVNDVTVGDGGWIIESISTYYSALDAEWGLGITEGYLHIFEKTGALPGELDDPTASPVVPMSAVLDGDHWVVTAAGLSVVVDPGEYWILTTPMAPSGAFGPEIHISSMTFIGDAAATYDVYAFPPPPMWFNMNPGVDASMLIEGTLVPTPANETTWGQVKSLYR